MARGFLKPMSEKHTKNESKIKPAHRKKRKEAGK
jgi:hypothetical protein